MTLGEELPPTDERILWMIRSGMVDAEIAARLNIPTAEVKQRIEQLARKYGVREREGLRTSTLSTPERGATQRSRAIVFTRRFVPYAVAGVLCAAIGAAVAIVCNLAPPDVTPATSSAGSPKQQPTSTPETVAIDGREWVAAGRIIAPFGGFQPVASTSQREEITVVTLLRESLIRPAESWYVSPANGDAFGGSAVGLPLVLTFIPWGASGLVVIEDGMVAYSRDGNPVQLMLTATERMAGRSHPVLVVPDGSIFIDPRPSRADVPVDYNTGEALNLGLAVLVGNLGPAAHGTATNWCDHEPACRAVLVIPSAEELLAPSAGNIACPDGKFSPGQVLTFENTPFNLHFQRIVMGVNGVAAGELRCLANGTVGSGAPMLDGGSRYRLDATDFAGTPVSVVVDGNGNVWAGEIKPRLGCPCRSGN